MDEARVGQKGRLCHRWWRKGQRPPGRCDKRFEWAYIFAAIEPATGTDVALVLPEATTATMSLFLAELAASLPEDVHAVLVLVHIEVAAQDEGVVHVDLQQLGQLGRREAETPLEVHLAYGRRLGVRIPMMSAVCFDAMSAGDSD